MTSSDLLRTLPSVDELCQYVFVRRNARVVRANVVLMRELVAERIAPLVTNGSVEPLPIPMILHCPECSKRHIDAGEFATRPHHTHACQHCGLVWRPAVVPTVGVRFLPGFKDETKPLCSSICMCPATSECDDPCPRHGIVGIGVTPR